MRDLGEKLGKAEAAEGEREESVAAKKGGGPRRAGHRSNGCRASRGRLPLEPHPSSGSFQMHLEGRGAEEWVQGAAGRGHAQGRVRRVGEERTGERTEERCEGEEESDRWGPLVRGREKERETRSG
jgi:hypothetical protein